jgi:hypothetical protein
MVRQFVHGASERTPEQMAAWQERYGTFDAALVRTGGGYDRYFRERPDEWRVVAESGTAVFYARREAVGNASGPR